MPIDLCCRFEVIPETESSQVPCRRTGSDRSFPPIAVASYQLDARYCCVIEIGTTPLTRGEQLAGEPSCCVCILQRKHAFTARTQYDELTAVMERLAGTLHGRREVRYGPD
jgi:hypothetical protein